VDEDRPPHAQRRELRQAAVLGRRWAGGPSPGRLGGEAELDQLVVAPAGPSISRQSQPRSPLQLRVSATAPPAGTPASRRCARRSAGTPRRGRVVRPPIPNRSRLVVGTSNARQDSPSATATSAPGIIACHSTVQ
jgi:hypothetical protein